MRTTESATARATIFPKNYLEIRVKILPESGFNVQALEKQHIFS